MRSCVTIILLILSLFILASCRSSRLNNDQHDRFLILVIKNEPGVIESIMSSCDCLQIINIVVLHTEKNNTDAFSVRSIPVSTMRVLLKIKHNESDAVIDRLAMIEDVMSLKPAN